MTKTSDRSGFLYGIDCSVSHIVSYLRFFYGQYGNQRALMPVLEIWRALLPGN